MLEVDNEGMTYIEYKTFFHVGYVGSTAYGRENDLRNMDKETKRY